MIAPLRGALSAALLGLVACAGAPPALEPFEARLAGDAIVLLGEVHDNPAHHAQRLALLERAVARGWRPALLMEQLDREQQRAIDGVYRETRAHPERAIETPPGWDHAFYRPFIALALRYRLPLVAANVSREDAKRIAREGLGAVFTPEELAELGLDVPRPADWQAAQEREIDAGHCHALPPEVWPSLARVQFARDAVMAALLAKHAEHGAVLLAGNGHVRRDLGAPRWLSPELQRRTFVVGYLETGSEPPPGAFDAVVVTEPAEREDPCAAFGNGV
ncbi:MAG: ChaN family lipoprotein [Myxococcota bacterium]